jgi:hypothetical protein
LFFVADFAAAGLAAVALLLPAVLLPVLLAVDLEVVLDALGFVEGLAADFDAVDFDAVDFDAVDFDAVDFAGDFFAVAFELEPFDAALRVAVGLRLRAERDRATRVGRFQPTALSARNVRGIERMFSGLSITAAAAASARSARTSEITFAGRRARAAWTRFVSRRTNIWRSGSIQIDVPV